ncbi:type II toxin-antitoxin system RelE/ParE family toxin [Bradyrhizobium sp. WBOS2]|nr:MULTISPECIES: type II toxin-antitoxin system RelE/ParE family toxin [unclassified Bradyrhizobium]
MRGQRLPHPRRRRNEANSQPKLKSAQLGPSTVCETPLHASGDRRPRFHLDPHCGSVASGSSARQKRIHDVIGLLLVHPEIGLRTDDPDIRRLATTPYPFLVFYEVGSEEIIIHAVRHGARDPGGMPGTRGSS